MLAEKLDQDWIKITDWFTPKSDVASKVPESIGIRDLLVLEDDVSEGPPETVGCIIWPVPLPVPLKMELKKSFGPAGSPVCDGKPKVSSKAVHTALRGVV